MRATHCTADDLYLALARINADKYDGNIKIIELRPDGMAYRFRLAVLSFDKPGYRRTSPQRVWTRTAPVHETWREGKRMKNACWHVHGHFFDAPFQIAPDARVRAGDLTITRAGGNWTDRNIGSTYYPFYFSEACDCDEYVRIDAVASPGGSARGGF